VDHKGNDIVKDSRLGRLLGFYYRDACPNNAAGPSGDERAAA